MILQFVQVWEKWSYAGKSKWLPLFCMLFVVVNLRRGKWETTCRPSPHVSNAFHLPDTQNSRTACAKSVFVVLLVIYTSLVWPYFHAVRLEGVFREHRVRTCSWRYLPVWQTSGVYSLQMSSYQSSPAAALQKVNVVTLKCVSLEWWVSLTRVQLKALGLAFQSFDAAPTSK